MTTLADVVVSEWTKLRSLRSTVWSFAALAVLSLGLTVLATSIYTAGWEKLSADDRRQMVEDPIGLILQPGALWGQIALCVLGVLIFASEYSTGMIRTTMLAVPRRTPVLAAKAIIFACATFVVAECMALLSFFVGKAIISPHVSVSLSDPGVPRAIVGTGLYLALIGLLALSIGAIVRHVAGAITLVLAMVVVVPTLGSLLPGNAGEYVSKFVPGGTAGATIMSSGRGSDSVVSPWQGFSLNRRDV